MDTVGPYTTAGDDAGPVAAADAAELLRELRFRACVDEEFRQALIAGELAEVATTYGLDPALFDGVRFVETRTGRAGEVLLPRRIEQGTSLTTAELQSLVPGGRADDVVAESCWFTEVCVETGSTPPPPPRDPWPCWFTEIAT